MGHFERFSYFAASVVLSAGLVTLASAQTGTSNTGGVPNQSSNTQMSNAGSSSASGGGLSSSDRHFMIKAAQGGVAEVEMGKLATQKASSEEVKQFGQRMVDDHSKANDQLKQLAQSKGVNLPTTPNAKDKADEERLSKLSGKQFDQAYMAEMRKDHTHDVAEFKTESKAAHDPDVKNFAAQTLPTLQSHLKDAESMKPKTQASNNGMSK